MTRGGIDAVEKVIGLGLTLTKIDILHALTRERGLTTTELMAMTGYSRSWLLRYLRDLEDLGLVGSQERRRDHSTKPVRHFWVDQGTIEELAWAAYDCIARAAQPAEP